MKVLIIGITGQDGTLLRQNFEASGADVMGFSRSRIYRSGNRPYPDVPDLLDYTSMAALIADFRPDEIYYLAAFHTSSEGANASPFHEIFHMSQGTHVTGLVHCLNAMVNHVPDCRLFYAASSLIFGNPDQEVQDESTPLSPRGAYGITKGQAIWLCNEFQKTKGIFASVGILYNHESHLREDHFLSQKIIRGAIRASRDAPQPLVLGSLDTKVDWSYAPDVVDAMQRIMNLETPETFIISRGEAHTVQEFAELAYGYFNLDWKNYIVENPQLLTRPPRTRIGDPTNLFKKTGWGPSLTFAEMVRQLIKDTLATGI